MVDNELIDQVIAMAFMNQHLYSKMQFDNAKDTATLLTVADQNREMMITATKSRLIPFTEELLERSLRKAIDEHEGNIHITLSSGEFVKIKIEIDPQTNGDLVGGAK